MEFFGDFKSNDFVEYLVMTTSMMYQNEIINVHRKRLKEVSK